MGNWESESSQDPSGKYILVPKRRSGFFLGYRIGAKIIPVPITILVHMTPLVLALNVSQGKER